MTCVPNVRQWNRESLRAAIALYCLDYMARESAPHLPGLADFLGISVRTLHRLTSQHLETTPGAYLRAARIDLAKDLLSGTTWTADRVATVAGFGTSHTLYRVFRDSTGWPPSEYRSSGTEEGRDGSDRLEP